MENRQNPTSLENLPDLKSNLSADVRYAALVDFKALGGIITDEEGNFKKQSMQWLADVLELNRDTLYSWMKNDGFWEAVNERRKVVAPRSRLANMHNVWYLSALKPGEKGFRDRQLWLANFDPNFRMPTQEVKHEAGNSWAALFERRQNDVAAVERKVIEGETTDAGS